MPCPASASREFVSKVKFRNEQVNKQGPAGGGLLAVSAVKDSTNRVVEFRRGRVGDAQFQMHAQLLFVNDDTKAFVDASVGSGYPRKFERRARRDGCRAGGSRMRQLAAGFLAPPCWDSMRKTVGRANQRAAIARRPDLGPWRSLLWGVGPYRRARRAGRRR